MTNKKKLLLLAGAGTHTKVIKAAKEMGLYTIVTDYLVDSPAKQIADESWMYSITDVDLIVNKCKEVGVSGVLNFCIDPAQRPYQEICERLGLPCTVTKEQLDIMTDKTAFKSYCRSHNVDVIPDYSLEDIARGNAEYPLFIKPAVSRGSRSQFICYNKQEAISAIECASRESSDGKVICEKYMGGKQDIGSAFFVIDGEPYLVKLGDRLLGREEDHLANQVMCTRLPSTSSAIIAKNSLPRVKTMIRSLGIRFGPVFLQGFLDGNVVRYYDPALRMPGGDYDLILKLATGFDTVKSMIHFAMTGQTDTAFGNPKECYRLKNGTALLFTISVRPGKMCRVEGMEKLLQHPYVVYGRQIISAGAVIPDSGDIKQRVAAIGAYIPNSEDVPSFIQEVYDTYHVYDDSGNDMIISKITASRL